MQETMNDEDKLKLEALIGRELRNLPDLQAPETLFHRVMLEVHTRAREPWWRRSWQGWPPGLQAVTLVALLGLAAVLSYGLGQTLQEIPYEALEGTFYEWLGPLARLWELGGTVMNATGLVMKAGGQQVLLYGSMLILVAYAFCLGLGAAVARAVMSRAGNGRI
jgi:hypothetical protein